MKKHVLILLVSIIVYNSVSCQNQNRKTTVTDDYELMVSEEDQALLILFPGFPENAQRTKEEFNILKEAKENKISLLLMNFNQHLHMLDSEKIAVTKILENVIKKHNLNKDNITIGGFSSGGNVSLLLSNYLVKTNNEIQPKRVFIVDSPLDLLALYHTSLRKDKRINDENSEAHMLVNYFESEFGNPEESIVGYEKHAPITLETNTITNIEELKDINIRLYTEPDIEWWKTERQESYEDMNAFFIKNLSILLKEKDWKEVELIETENKGYRSNGTRHPHSWSIIDKEGLIEWIK